MMYDPKTGKGYKANKPADHKRMKKLGYLHADEMKKTSKAQVGDQISGVDGAKGDQDGSPMNFMQRASSELGDEMGSFKKWEVKFYQMFLSLKICLRLRRSKKEDLSNN